MKKACCSAAVVLVAFSIQAAEMVCVVEITDFTKKPSFEIMSSAEAKALQKTIEAEKRVFPKALEEVRKEWNASEKPATGALAVKGEKPPPPIPFPTGAVGPREIRVRAEALDRQKADKRISQLEDNLGNGAHSARKVMTAADKQKQAREALREAERSAMAERAAGMLQAKVDELMKMNAAGGAAAAAAPATGDKEKAAEPKPAAQPDAGKQPQPAAAK